MTDLQIYNTWSRTKEVFTPLKPGKIGMYVCGITVYDYCHIGHARVLVAFDVITRYLRSQGWDVTYIRNITDIDDKILNRAEENGEPFTALTERMISAMHEDEAALGIARPDQEPRATAHMDDILDMIRILVDNHYAYAADNGDVYYRVSRFATRPHGLVELVKIGKDASKTRPKRSPLLRAKLLSIHTNLATLREVQP